MGLRFGRRPSAWIALGLAAALASLAEAPAQPPPDRSPFSPPVAQGDANRAAMEDRIRQLELMVQQLSGQVQALSAAKPPSGGMSTTGRVPTAATDTGSPGSNVTPSASGGPAAPGQSLPPNPPPSNRFESPATLANLRANVKFGPGFEIKTDDEEFILQFHNLTQVDYRGYQQGGQNPVHDTFAIPRQWFMFSGRITRPVGYFVSLQQAFDVVVPLDVFVDLSYSPKLQARIGRFKTPFTYEFLVEPIQALQLPERSLFFNNFGQNRDIGGMAYGRLFANTFDYAIGVFNGTRNGFVANQDAKFVSGLVNWRPFGNAEGTVLENLNFGASVYAGNANSPVIPQTLRTVVATTGNAVIGVPFLTFNNNVRETGNQSFGDIHAAWFYKQFALLAEYGFGAQDYSLSGTPAQRTRLPVNSVYLQGGYLLTGETRSSLGIVKPLRPFDLREGQRGPGAWELVGRYQFMDIGNQVFTDGLADPNNGANRLFVTDLGFNWHMTQYLKLYVDWEHSEFNQPVLFAPGRRQLTSDLFIVRLQLYF